MSKLGNEKYSVQNPLINYVSEHSAEYITKNNQSVFVNLGWERITPEESLRLRGGETGFIFKDVFIKQIQKLNLGFLDHLLAEELIKKLNQLPATIEGNFIAWEYLKGLRTIFVPNEKRERNVKLIDVENIENNVFHVTDEFTYTNGTKTIRADIVFLINGIPLILVETKAAHKIEGMSEALEQIKRYHRDCPEPLTLMQLYALTHIIKFYYGATWNTSGKSLLSWKDEIIGSYETLVKTFFDKKRIIQILTDFILFTRQDEELKKVVLRPHQMRAANKIIERANDPQKNRGLIWHTQGSGKTYTMIVTAQMLLQNPIFENPTVLMLVDRNELESQLFANLSAVGIGNVKVADSKKDLQSLLQSNYRGLIVSMIHKFEGMPGNINGRKNIFVLIDEAHRTTTGKLGNYLMGALPNATYIGFTGTPIDKSKHGKGTFITFGINDEPHGYLDKYGIAESIEDGTTVPLHYTLAPNDLRVDKETLEKEFLNIVETEGISDIETLNKVLEKAVTLKNMLKNSDRVKRIAEYVANHFKEYIEPMGYKAFLVAVDREACAMYKEELNKHLPEEHSKVVYSPYYNDPPELSKYHLSEDEEKRIRKAFRNPDEIPKILIVTEKLLTGFDAPILYCIYLDKPMRDHVLLQTIARVNRPYEDKEGRRKPSGFIFDFVGIFDKLEKALAFDSTDIEGVVQDLNVLKDTFAEKMEFAKQNYLPLIKDKSSDKSVETLLEYFLDEEKRQEFYQFFKELSGIYEILSPDEFLRPYLQDYETLTRMYQIVRECYEPKTSVDKELTKKTVKLVQQHTQTDSIQISNEIYEINETTLKKLEESQASDIEKVFNILKAIGEKVTLEGITAPYLISIGERAEIIAQAFKDRQNTTQQTLEELKKIIAEINNAQKEQASKNLPKDTFAIYWILKKENLQNVEDLATQINHIMNEYPYWYSDDKQKREVKKKMLSLILKNGIGEADKANNITETIIKSLKLAKSV